MGTHKADDWDKPRHQGVHMRASEIARLRSAFDEGRHYRDIARELKCASRTASSYYAKFRGYVRPDRGRPRTKQPDPIPPQPKPKPQRESRFYTSTFEL